MYFDFLILLTKLEIVLFTDFDLDRRRTALFEAFEVSHGDLVVGGERYVDKGFVSGDVFGEVVYFGGFDVVIAYLELE
jgi:hypothetical protein